MFISSAFAADAASAGAGGLGGFLPLIIIFAIFYFLLIRPQQKKLKAHQEMVKNVAKGEKVINSGGIIGVIKSVNEESGIISLEIADKVVIEMQRDAISEIISSPTKSKTAEKKSAKTSSKKK